MKLGEKIVNEGGNRSKGIRDSKRLKLRAERRKARQNPEKEPTYGRYHGWSD